MVPSMNLRLGLCILLMTSNPLLADQVSSAGRLEFKSTNGSCSASLIRPNVIVTAAHCAGGDPADGIVFRPGDGQTGKTYPVKRFIQHPLYNKENSRVEWRYRFDIAAAELAEPVPDFRADPLPLGDDAKLGETLFIVSWRWFEGNRPRQRACPVIEGLAGLVTLGCSVLGGESGAPVLRKTAQGLELVAVISSRGQQLEQPIAQASDVRLRIPPLLNALGDP